MVEAQPSDVKPADIGEVAGDVSADMKNSGGTGGTEEPAVMGQYKSGVLQRGYQVTRGSRVCDQEDVTACVDLMLAIGNAEVSDLLHGL